jgi:hypothetical protein
VKKAFPHLLLRLGGLSYDALQPFVFENETTIDFYKKYQSLKEQEAFINVFFTKKINQTTNHELKKYLKNIRNDIFNGRKIAFQKWLNIELFDEKIQEQLQLLKERQEDYLTIEITFKKAFEIHLEHGQKTLQTLSNHSNLQNGLVLSAPSLLSRIPNYQQKTLLQFRKKELQTGRALMQYLARMALKTSPFSTFNQISSIPLGTENSFLENGEIQKTTTHLRLNNYLFFYFKNLIIQDLPTRLELPLLVNATYKVENDQHLFLTNSNNIEAFQTVDFHPVIDFITNTLATKKLNYGELILELAANIEANEADLQGFVQELYEIGLLEYDFGVSGLQANWHLELMAFLEKLTPNPFIETVFNELLKLESGIQSYQKAVATKRLAILKEMHRDLSLLFQKEISKTTEADFFKKDTTTDFHLTTSNLLFEDASAKVTGTISQAEMEIWTNKLDILVQYLVALQGDLNSYQRIKTCFEEIFEPQNSVDILTFYQKYATWKQAHQNDLSFENAQNTRIENWQTALREHLGNRVFEEKIHISAADLEAVSTSFFDNKNEKITTKSTAKTSAFVQFFKNTQKRETRPPEGLREARLGVKPLKAATTSRFSQPEGRSRLSPLKGVVNAIFPAYGKYFSRFLHLLNDEVTTAIQAQNAKDKTALHAEIVDNSYFNANIHPPLMPFEIKIPNGNTTLSSEKLLSIQDIFIKKEEKELILIHQPTEKRVFPYDLGFQSLDGRSELFKLLNGFSPARFVPLYHLSDAIVKAFDNEKTVKIIPRIIFENDVIVQRKRWYFAQKVLPFSKKNNETTADYFIRLQKWCILHHLPNEVFYTIEPKELSDTIDRKTDNHKPQYLDFRNPILVDIFGRNCSKVTIALRIEEFLPSAEMLNKLGEEQFVMEFLV